MRGRNNVLLGSIGLRELQTRTRVREKGSLTTSISSTVVYECTVIALFVSKGFSILKRIRAAF